MGSVQRWTRPVPASNVAGVAAATTTSGSPLPSAPPPVQHLLAIPSPHYSHPLAAKPSNSLPQRPFLRWRASRSPCSHCNAAYHHDFSDLQTHPTNSPDIPRGLPTHAMPAIALPKPVQGLQRRYHVPEPNRQNHAKTPLHTHTELTTPFCVRIQCLSDLDRSPTTTPKPRAKPPEPSSHLESSSE